MNSQTHWEKIYKEKAPDTVSWYRPHLETSLALIEEVAPSCSTSIIDVGGGESTLVDDLLDMSRITSGRIRLQPANSSMQPIMVNAEDVQIQGRVLAVLRKYK